MARLQMSTGDSIEVLLEEIREKFKGDAKIVSATRTKRRSAFGLASRYRYELLVERLSQSQVLELPTGAMVAGSELDAFGDLPSQEAREAAAPLPVAQYASFAIELQNAYMSAKGIKKAPEAGSFVGSEAEDTLVLSSVAKKGMAQSSKPSAKANPRIAPRDERIAGSVRGGLLATGSEDFAAQANSNRAEIASMYTPMVVNNEGKWRVPQRISEPSWRSLDDSADMLSGATNMSITTEEIGSLAKGTGGPSEAELRFGYPKGADRKADLRRPSAVQSQNLELVIDLTDNSNLIKFPSPHFDANNPSSSNGFDLAPLEANTIRDELSEFVSELHDWPIINSGDVVIFVGSSPQAMSSFDTVCDIYGVDEDRRFIVAGSGIPKWLGTALQRVTAAIAEGHRSTRTFAIWLSEEEVAPVIEKLGRRTSVLVAHVDDPTRGEALRLSSLPRVDALSLSSIDSADGLLEVFKYGLPVLALEGERS
ncbi:MAG: hypothetical protein HKL81_08780, partial [Acidimicrobiaceae bacterium]|nr:hypothetical protein [Acidimicrobiaceae bacterium]